MSTFHDFLVWFDGWAENIEERPTEKQWQRLRDKVSKIAAAEPAQPVHEVSAPAAPKPAPDLKPQNEMQWRSAFMGALCEDFGYDPESAAEMFDDYKRDHSPIDITANAKAAARSMHADGAN